MAIGNPISLTSNVATKTINVIATASQTLFTVTGGYRLNELSVFRNGVRLVNGRDFTARDGSIVTLLSAATEGDVLEFQVFDTFRIADAITPFDSAQTIAGDLSIVGVLSATQLGSVNFNLTSGIQTFHDVRVGGALTVAGTLTYEDTTNTTNTGLSTFSGGMNISGVGATITTLNVTGVSTFASNVSIADSIFHTGDTNTAIRFPANDTFSVEINGGEVLRVDSSGNTGINCISGGGKLAIRANASTYEGLELQTPSGDGSGEFHIGVHQTGTTSGRSVVLKRGGADGMDTESLRVSADGNVGINSTIPRSKLHVANGNSNFNTGNPTGLGAGAVASLESNTDVALQFLTSTTTDNFIYFGDTDSATTGSIQYDHNVNSLIFNVNGGTERLRITSAGKVGINSTSPGNTLSVGGDMGLYRSGTQHGTYYVYKDNVATAWFKYRGDTNVVIIGTNAGDKLTINPSGDLNVAGITTATQLFEGTTRVATSGKAIAMALIFG